MAKKRTSKKHLAEIAKKLEIQRKRALRPQLPVNTHAPVSKSLKEKKTSLDRKDARRGWAEE